MRCTRGLWSLALGVCAACRFGFDPAVRSDGGVADAAPGYSLISGTVSGLTGTGLVLENDVGDTLPIAADGSFAFPTPIMDGQTYSIAVRSQPSGQACSIANASGIAGAGASGDIAVTCYAAGACPTQLTFTANGTFTLPSGCTSFTVDAYGGGGAGGGRNMGSAAAAGGAGGHATKTLTAQAANTVYKITIGLGGTCGSIAATAGGYAGGAGGKAGGNGNGSNGAGTTAPPGGLGGAGSTGTQPGGAGGNGGYGGGGGGGGGDVIAGDGGGGATTFQLASPVTDYVVAGGGGGAGAADQNGDVAGAGGAACTGTVGAPGQAAQGGTRSGGGGGGGACACTGGCDATPTSTGGAGGTAAATGGCTAAQDGLPGRIVLTFP